MPDRNLQGSEALGGALRVDRSQLLSIVEPVALTHGAEIVDLELKNEGGWILRVYVEKAGSAESGAQCADIATAFLGQSRLLRGLLPISGA